MNYYRLEGNLLFSSDEELELPSANKIGISGWLEDLSNESGKAVDNFKIGKPYIASWVETEQEPVTFEVRWGTEEKK